MKKHAILSLIILLTTSSFLFSQKSTDTTKEYKSYPQFSSFLSEEESWELHRDAYKKQLESKGLSEEEVEVKMLEYEKQKEQLINQIKEQRRLAEKHRKLAEVQRKKAGELREEAENHRKQAMKLRQQTAILRKDASVLRKQAEEQRKHSEILREQAKKLRKVAEELRNSVRNIFTETIIFSESKSENKSIKIKVEKKDPLFFNINGSVVSGNILIEIFDPNGKKEGELSLEQEKETDKNDHDEYLNRISGSLNKMINSTKVGDWEIRISSEKSQSTVHISVAQRVKPVTND